MVRRRELLGGGIVGGLLGALSDAGAGTAEGSPAQRQPQPLEGFKEVAEALTDLRDQLSREHSFSDISGIRNAQRLFLRTNLKMPDFLEVGANPWFALYDWHVRWQQELTVQRDAQGRYTILFMGTTVILRADSQEGFVGTPYDVR